jgi:hypothetical protein
VLNCTGELLKASESKETQPGRKKTADTPKRLKISAASSETQKAERKEAKAPDVSELPPPPALGEGTIPMPAEVENLYKEFLALSTAPQKSGNWDITKVLRRFLEPDHLLLKEAVRRVLILLTPSSLDMPSAFLVAWHYLLNEILISYTNPVPDILEEWIRRIDELKRITLQQQSSSHTKWSAEFTDACGSLRTMLRDLQ